MQAIRLLALLVLSSLAAGTARADIIPIDLNDFFADPTVTVSADGSTASFTEDPPFNVLLQNDPFFGDPEVIIAGVGTSLIFDFVFSEGAGNDDEFFAAVLLGSTGDSAGAGFEFFTGDSSAGSVAFDLSSLSSLIAEPFFGFEFNLLSFDNVFDSTLRISNMRLVTPDIAVPEPPVLFLMLAGLIAMAGTRRRTRRKSASIQVSQK